MATHCVVCDQIISANASRFTHSDRRKGIPGSWQFIECNFCNVISLQPVPTDLQLTRYYAKYPENENVDLTISLGFRYPLLRKIFHKLSGDVDPRDFIEVPVGARVLDYGCGLAGYLADFHSRGIAISGAEIAEYVVEACQHQGFDVHKVEDFSHIPFAGGEFDVIYLMQVFEHLRDPHAFMQELARILKDDGVLYLAVPNSASIWRKVFGDNWVSGWYAPFHLFHYNRDTLAKLAMRHGFDVSKSWTSTPESWFRLNLKAYLYPKENRLDWRKNWLDSRPMRYLLMIVLRIVELPFAERDCLVMKFQKRG